MCNTSVASAMALNFTDAERQSLAIEIGVDCNTPDEQVRSLPRVIKSALKLVQRVVVQEVYFKTFGDFALIFEIRFDVLSNDAAEAREAKGEIHKAINERMKKENINMPVPIRTIIAG
eukprot:NODE_1495_length_1146_cov_116.546946_g1181_i1.p2 GENE.NODE_1495_length_1146_cov_116.546946_g1181_i1~~NODE_1495_length_1146_cov_116.546946_g1181_i1.p2  ORF type:complete len:118 (+),score=45.61 NODE_1495_length_1146_cov_116.546946_g1181_i1:693-1046(+)